VTVNVFGSFIPRWTTFVLGPVVAVVLVGLSRWAGLSWDDLGLARPSWRRGVRYGVVAVAVAGVAYALGVALPPTRAAFLDVRYDLDAGRALLTALVLIPLRTILLEEVAFRGVLLGLLRRHRHGLWASGISSALFGLWHIVPSLALSSTNQAVGTVLGHGGRAQLPVVVAAVAFTGVAGMVFCELRRRSGSLIASAGLHWATNGLGVLVAAGLWTLHRT
jgi:membrane protease YdiL (CAAX protease family)